MNEKEKMLVIKDLSGRLPYGVFVEDKIVGRSFEKDGNVVYSPVVYDWSYHPNIKEVKPFLRPLSSMTEEERLELSRLTDDKFKFYLYTTKPEIVCYEKYNYLEGLKVLDWLNAHHFDYRGLIEKGLAIEAPEGMYKI